MLPPSQHVHLLTWYHPGAQDGRKTKERNTNQTRHTPHLTPATMAVNPLTSSLSKDP